MQEISRSYQVRELHIQAYLSEAQQNIADFEYVVIEHVPRSLNAHANALAKLTSATAIGIDHPIIIEVISKLHPQVEILEILEDDWMKPIYYFLTTEQIPEEVKEECRFRLSAISDRGLPQLERN